MAMKFYFHYTNELNASEQLKETKDYRNSQTDLTYHVKNKEVKVKLTKDKSQDNFYTGLFRIKNLISN